MRCPFCGAPDSRVIDTRPHEDGLRIRRRRLCEKCNMRFTTFETAERAVIWVVKRDGGREEFDANKMLNSMVRACRKQTISLEKLQGVVNELESRLYAGPEHEITSVQIGEFVMARLRDIDEVAYIRFASVYRDFTDAEAFYREIKKLVKDKEKNK